jgi:hypothetical protein
MLLRIDDVNVAAKKILGGKSYQERTVVSNMSVDPSVEVRYLESADKKLIALVATYPAKGVLSVAVSAPAWEEPQAQEQIVSLEPHNEKTSTNRGSCRGVGIGMG